MSKADIPKRHSYLPFARPLIEEEEINEVVDTLKSDWLTRGPKTARFEEEFGHYIGAKHAIALNSCTAGLHLILAAAGIGPGDEVITSPLTFCATANVVVHAGATPIFADVDPKTLNISASEIERKITDRTKAVLPVHFAGQPCDMEPINHIARKHNLLMVEDAAHGVGAEYRGVRVGNFGDAASFSFYATKNLTTGEGGMVTTNDDELAEKIRILSLHGISKDAWKRYSAEGSWYYEVMYPGFKYNMTDIQAALGIHQLRKLEQWRKLREEYVDYYNQQFRQLKSIRLPEIIPDIVHAWHLYTIMLTEQAPISRDEFIREMHQMNIGSSVHFIPIHLHPYYRETFGCGEGMCPIAEGVFKGIVSLPLYPAMSWDDVRYVADVVKELLG